jgi:hypothetical protein
LAKIEIIGAGDDPAGSRRDKALEKLAKIEIAGAGDYSPSGTGI